MTSIGSARNGWTRDGCRLIAIAVTLAVLALAGATSRAADAAPANSPPAAAEFQPVGARRSFAGLPPSVHEWSYELQRGPAPFDRLALHRYTRGAKPPQHPGLVMLYLPGTNMSGEVAVIDPHHSLPLFMANHGVDFWALDYRTHFIPPATPVANLTELKAWTSNLFESDIAEAADFVMRTTGRSQIFVAGFSRGASFAYLFAARHPHQVEGLVIFDGSIGIGRADAPPPPNRYADDVAGAHLTYDKRKALMEAVITNPDGPAPRIPMGPRRCRSTKPRARISNRWFTAPAGSSVDTAGWRIRPAAIPMRSCSRGCWSTTIATGRPSRITKIRSRPPISSNRGVEDSRHRLQQHQHRRAMARTRCAVGRLDRQ